MALTTPLYKQVFTEAALTVLVQARRMGGGPSFMWVLRQPRIRASPLGPVEPDIVRRHTLLLRYVSITEAYVDALMPGLLTEQLGPPSALLRSMVHEIELAASANWSKRLESFKRIHGFQLSKCDGWKEVEGATHARNLHRAWSRSPHGIPTAEPELRSGRRPRWDQCRRRRDCR